MKRAGASRLFLFHRAIGCKVLPPRAAVTLPLRTGVDGVHEVDRVNGGLRSELVAQARSERRHSERHQLFLTLVERERALREVR